MSEEKIYTLIKNTLPFNNIDDIKCPKCGATNLNNIYIQAKCTQFSEEFDFYCCRCFTYFEVVKV